MLLFVEASVWPNPPPPAGEVGLAAEESEGEEE